MSGIPCKVMVELLEIRERPTLSSPVHQKVHKGFMLTFIKKVHGDKVHLNNSDNANWGQLPNNFFFPLGGTDHPNG
jgi:hypothetical protein